MEQSNPRPSSPSSAHITVESPPEADSPLSKQSKSDSKLRLPLELVKSMEPYLKKTNMSVERINLLLSTTSGLDTTLSLICYASLFLTSMPSPALPQFLVQLLPNPLSGLSPAPPSKLPSLDSTKTTPRPQDPRASSPPSLRSLYGEISNFRTFLRTMDLLKIYSWTLSLHAAPPQDTVLKCIAYLQMASLAAYQALENISYLSGKGVLFRSLNKEKRVWCDIISCRFWTAWVVGEFVRIAREWQIWKSKNGEKGKSETGDATQIRAWKKDLIVNAAYLPLCLHWSVETGLGIPELTVGLLGTIAGVTGVRSAWERTAY